LIIEYGRMKMSVNEKLYKQEILELTSFIRNGDKFKQLQKLLTEEGFDLAQTMLVSFFEDEEGMEYGVLVENDKRVFEYTRYTMNDKKKDESLMVKEITNLPEEIEKYPQIPISFKLINEDKQ